MHRVGRASIIAAAARARSFASSAVKLAQEPSDLQPAAPNCDFVGEKENDMDVLLRNAKFVEIDPEKIRQLAREGAVEHHQHHSGCGCDGAHRDVSTLPPAERIQRYASTLSSVERNRLTDMIYKTHYSGEVSDGAEGVKAMRYQAALEVKFIEDHVETVYEHDKLSMNRDDVRRLIKKHVVERCDLHKPLSYIIGFQPFYGCHIDCVPPLLCPRPETEMWAHWLVTKHRLDQLSASSHGLNVLDLCCGTGCIGIALAKHVPSAHVTALDILPEAVTVSNNNAKQNGVADRYQAHESDMFAWLTQARSDVIFDMIVSNPPYVLPEQYESLPPTITHWESKYALVGDPSRESRQYMYFQELCDTGAKFTRPAALRGRELVGAPSIVIEIGLQGERVASIMDRHPAWCDVELHTDFAGQPRWISARRTTKTSW